jgi:pyruvate ferredoxin oxidoreductase beta subunit
VYAPCPTGWGIDAADTLEISRAAVACGLWYLAEFENGQFRLNHDPGELASVSGYLGMQERFGHLTNDNVAAIESARNRKWDKIRRAWHVEHNATQ